MSDASATPHSGVAEVPADQIAVSPAPTFSELPGRRLREARAARGLSVADVANTLKFGARQIEALETDDYRNLQGATFVRGFVRSYARFLKLAPEPLLDMLDAGAAIAPANVRPPEDTGVAMPMPGARRLSPWLAGAILMAIAAAGLLFWHLMAPDFSLMKPRETVAESPVTPPQPEVQAPVARIEPVVTPAAGTVAPAAAAALPANSRQLVFILSGKSWLEVRDASQRVVLSGEFPAGERQVATGKAPFYLWVGRASVLRVLDGEREIDLKPFARDDVARLTVE